MKSNRFTIAAALNLTAARFANSAEITAVSGMTELGSPIDAPEPACASDHMQVETCDGNTAIAIKIEGETVTPLHQGQLIQRRPQTTKQENSQQRVQQQPSKQVPPIQIVRQSQSFVEFQVNNSTFFASAASSAGFLDGVADDNGFQSNAPLQMFTVLPTDVFGSEHCRMLNNGGSRLLGDSAYSSEVMKANCDSDGSFTVVHAHVRFTDNADDIKLSRLRVPKCCPHHPDDDSPSKVIRYAFKLMCSPTCDDAIHYADGLATHSTADSSEPTGPLRWVKSKTNRAGSVSPGRIATANANLLAAAAEEENALFAANQATTAHEAAVAAAAAQIAAANQAVDNALAASANHAAAASLDADDAANHYAAATNYASAAAADKASTAHNAAAAKYIGAAAAAADNQVAAIAANDAAAAARAAAVAANKAAIAADSAAAAALNNAGVAMDYAHSGAAAHYASAGAAMGYIHNIIGSGDSAGGASSGTSVAVAADSTVADYAVAAAAADKAAMDYAAAADAANKAAVNYATAAGDDAAAAAAAVDYVTADMAPPPSRFKAIMKKIKYVLPAALIVLVAPVWFLGGFSGCGADSPVGWNSF